MFYIYEVIYLVSEGVLESNMGNILDFIGDELLILVVLYMIFSNIGV